MTINSTIDERRDPYFATEAAAKLLKLNMDELQSWPLAITAYNHGLTGMKNAVKRTGSRDFGDIVEHYNSRTFGFASRNFYAEFLAARQVAKEYKSYFGDVTLRVPEKFQSIRLHNSTFLRNLADILDLPQDTLVVYNPALRWTVTSNKRQIPKGYELRLPSREGYDPREVFVSTTPPAPAQRTAMPVAKSLLAYQSSDNDSTRSISEAQVMRLLKKPTPYLHDPDAAVAETSSSGM